MQYRSCLNILMFPLLFAGCEKASDTIKPVEAKVDIDSHSIVSDDGLWRKVPCETLLNTMGEDKWYAELRALDEKVSGCYLSNVFEDEEFGEMIFGESRVTWESGLSYSYQLLPPEISIRDLDLKNFKKDSEVKIIEIAKKLTSEMVDLENDISKDPNVTVYENPILGLNTLLTITRNATGERTTSISYTNSF